MKHYVLIIKNSCGHCQDAISLLQEKELAFVYNDMEHSPNALEVSKKQCEWETVPMIWEQEVDWESGGHVEDNLFLGGLSELKDFLSEDDEEEDKDD